MVDPSMRTSLHQANDITLNTLENKEMIPT